MDQRRFSASVSSTNAASMRVAPRPPLGASSVSPHTIFGLRAPRPPTASTRRPSTAQRSGRSSSTAAASARVSSSSWVAPQDVEDAAYVRAELDRFEVEKSRQLGATLDRSRDARHLDVGSATDRDAHHAQLKALLRVTGGRRPGSKANDVVVFEGRHYQKFPAPLETGKSPLMLWLRDLRALRVHDFVIAMRARGVTSADLPEMWFSHSKQNSSMTLTNAHTSLKGLIAEVLAIPEAELSTLRCQEFYDRLNDRKQGTMDFGPAAPKLDLLVAPVDAASWEHFLNLFVSGVHSRIGPEDFASPHDFLAALDVLEALVVESEAAVDPAFLEAAAARQSAAAVEAAAQAAMARSRRRTRAKSLAASTALRPVQVGVHPNAHRDPPKSFWRLLAVYRADIQAFAERVPTGKMLTLAQALALFTPGAAFVKALRSGVYKGAVDAASQLADTLARRKRDAERAQLLSQMSRMRLPNAEAAKAQAKQAAEAAVASGAFPSGSSSSEDDSSESEY